MNRTAQLMAVALGLAGATAAIAGGYYDSGYARRGAYDYPSAYVGLSLGSLRYSEDGLDTLTPTAALLRLGVPVSRNLAFEVRAGGGLADSSHGGYTASLDTIYGAYVKGSLPLGPAFSLYGVGGVAGVTMHRDFGYSSSRDTGLSFGLGADINLGGGAGINLEWTRLPSGNNAGYDYTSSMATAGVTWRF